jgi:hypothetical protein
MTNAPDDPIRDRLRGHDPLHRHHHPIPPAPPAHLLEQIMTTSITPTDDPTATDPSLTGPAAPDRPRNRRRWQLGGAGVGLAAAITTAILVTGNGGTSPSALELGLGEGGAMASCLPVAAEILADMPIAFAGEVTDVTGETITVDVSTWYAGGDADRVVLTAPAGLEALIGGIDFVEGEPYLVAASEGTVNYCGYSGPATADLQSVYDAAFPAS